MEEFISQIAAARKEAEEIAKGDQTAEQAWYADRDNFLSLLGRYDKIIKEMSMQNKRVLLQYKAEKNVLESKFNDAKARTQELLEKMEGDRYLLDSEKGNLERNVAELQTHLDLMASERGSMTKDNIELTNEVGFLKTQVNQYNATLVSLEAERQVLKDELASNEERLEVLLTKTATMENEINRLQQVNEEVKQQTEILQEEVDSTRGLLETQKQRAEESIAQSGIFTKQAEELGNRIAELQDTLKTEEKQKMEFESLHAEVAQKYRQVEQKHFESLKENEEQGKIIESLQEENASLQSEKSLLLQSLKDVTKRSEEISEVAQKYRQVEQKHFESLRENEEQGKMIESLQEENASLQTEKSLLLQSLKEATKRSEEISKNWLKSDQEVLDLEMLDLESQSFGLHTELMATKLGCDGATIELNKIKEDMKISNGSFQIQEEKESLHEKLMLQPSRNKVLEEELRSTKSSLQEMKELASKGEHQVHHVWSELLAFAEEEDDQIVDIQSQLLAIVEDKMSLLTDLQDQLSSLAAAKMFVDEENNSLQIELDRRTLVSEEEKVNLKGGLRELETAPESLSEDLDSFRAISEEKEGKIVDFQYQLSMIVEAKMCLEEKNSSLLTNLNKCTMVSKENARLQDRIRELESSLNSLKKDVESKGTRLQKFREYKPLQGKSLVLESRKPNCVHESENGLNEKPKPNGAIGKRTTKPVAEKQTLPKPAPEKRTPKQVPEKPKKIWL